METAAVVQDAPGIPTLKEKEEERRGGGVPLTFVSRVSGVTLGEGSGAPLANSVRWGMAGRNGSAALVSAVFGSRLTPGAGAALAVGAGTAVLLAALGLLPGDRSDPGSSRPTVWGPPPAPAPIESFGVASGMPGGEVRAAPGELVAPDPVAEAPREERKTVLQAPAAPKPQPAPPAPPEAAKKPETPVPAVTAAAPRLPNAFGFGGGPRRAGGDGLRDSLAPFGGVKSTGVMPPMKEPAAGPLASPERDLRAASTRAQELKASSARAMGQLKFADKESFAALGATGADQPRQYAADAFDQAKSIGAASPISGTGMTPGDTMGPIGSGAPDVTQPPIGPTENKTPYQNQADNAKQNTDMAKILTLLGAALLAAGAMVMMIGKKLMANPLTHTAGVVVLALGAALLAAGAGAILAGMMMGQQAKNDGNGIAQDSGQKDQGKTINQCADQATSGQDCHPTPIQQPGNTVHQDVLAESSAGYDLQGGGHPVSQ